MSIAASEMPNPPREIRSISWVLCGQLLLLVVGAVAAGYELPRFSAGALSLYWLSHFAACVLLVFAARKMQRNWRLYGLLPIIAPLAGPLMSLMLLKYFRHSGGAGGT